MKPSLRTGIAAAQFLIVFIALGAASLLLAFQLFEQMLRIVFGGGMPHGDWRALQRWSSLVFFPCLLLVYLPALAWLDDRATGRYRLLTFAVSGGVLGFAPVVAMGALFRGRTADILSLQTLGIAGPFVLAGAFLAMGYSVIMPRLPVD